MENFNSQVKERRIKVNKINDRTITFEESWFFVDDTITNDRTGKSYWVDVLSKEGFTATLLGWDEWEPYSIKEGDLFYVNRELKYSKENNYGER